MSRAAGREMEKGIFDGSHGTPWALSLHVRWKSLRTRNNKPAPAAGPIGSVIIFIRRRVQARFGLLVVQGLFGSAAVEAWHVVRELGPRPSCPACAPKLKKSSSVTSPTPRRERPPFLPPIARIPPRPSHVRVFALRSVPRNVLMLQSL